MKLTEAERNALELGIYLPMLLSSLENDKKLIEKHFKIKRPYLHLLNQVGQEVHNSQYEVQQFLLKRRLKVVEIERDDMFTAYSFSIRGYEQKHKYFHAHIRNQVEKLLHRYLQDSSFTGKYDSNDLQKQAPCFTIE